MKTINDFASIKIFHSRKEKMQCSVISSPFLTLLVPFQGSAPWCWLLSPPGGGVSRPRGPDGASGGDAADLALSYPTSRLPVPLVVAAPVLIRFKLPPCGQRCESQ